MQLNWGIFDYGHTKNLVGNYVLNFDFKQKYFLK